MPKRTRLKNVDIMQKIAADCRIWRMMKDISLEEVAAAVGMTRQAVDYFERGKTLSEPLLLYYVFAGAVDMKVVSGWMAEVKT